MTVPEDPLTDPTLDTAPMTVVHLLGGAGSAHDLIVSATVLRQGMVIEAQRATAATPAAEADWVVILRLALPYGRAYDHEHVVTPSQALAALRAANEVGHGLRLETRDVEGDGEDAVWLASWTMLPTVMDPTVAAYLASE